jgi:hypothetical protein
MRRWLISLAALGLVVAMVTYARTRPLDVHVEDILRLEMEPYPEGPLGPIFTREPHGKDETYTFDLGVIERFIPDPLPNTAWQGLLCRNGGILSVSLLGGEETITYGPCRRPASINALWAHMIDIASEGACKPGCGPGIS